MIKVEAVTLEAAYSDAASEYDCSVTELNIEVIQTPSKGFLGFFARKAIIVATKKENTSTPKKSSNKPQNTKPKQKAQKQEQMVLNDTIMPQSFAHAQDDEEEVEPIKEPFVDASLEMIATEVRKDINDLFAKICFDIDEVKVSVYEENTLLIEFSGEDAALLIGKEGYRYKALSYMLFNWLNTKYQVQLRLEIAEFLKNQEEAISRYLVGVCEGIDRDGRAQTKILDGVLVQIALRELRERYPDKYVAIRSTRDGMKYIIVNDYNAH